MGHVVDVCRNMMCRKPSGNPSPVPNISDQLEYQHPSQAQLEKLLSSAREGGREARGPGPTNFSHTAPRGRHKPQSWRFPHGPGSGTHDGTARETCAHLRNPVNGAVAVFLRSFHLVVTKLVPQRGVPGV